ncbi:MAG: hypothetical protein NW220_17290 [Leptolyngbyaceae cyanobacterium bins.349]|nr:hypothetical protein [Leptolyngbyaceae cyanobacterium bins.349]
MLTDRLPLELLAIPPSAIAGTSLWALALYLGFSPVSDWVIHQLTRWFNFAEQTLYPSREELERTRAARAAQNSFYASFFSIFPFLAVGILCNVGVEVTLGASWAVSTGILACMGCGVYELGRRDGQSSE